ncbi:MAG: HD-GYP domain-containing protein [Bacillota bacterium]
MELENSRDMNQLFCFAEALRELKDFYFAELSPLEKVANNILSYLLRVTGAQDGLVAVLAKEGVIRAATTRGALSVSKEEIALLRSAAGPVTCVDSRKTMLIPLKVKKNPAGLIKLVRSDAFTKKDSRYAAYLSYFAAMAVERAKARTGAGNLTNARLLARTVELHAPSTKKHSLGVTRYSLVIAGKMSLSRAFCQTLRDAALLHDIGKIAIPEEILLKNGPLTREEFNLVKRHPVIGAGILGRQEGYEETASFILHHHERWDGNGYPHGLARQEIPLGARIIAVADAFEAMTSHRSYRKALNRDEAAGELIKNSGTQFDPQVVEVFLG